MAPRETPKATPKVQRTIVKIKTTSKQRPSSTDKRTMSTKKAGEKAQEKVPLKVRNMTQVNIRQRTSTVPKVSTPKPKENKSVPLPGSVVKSAKKATWNRRPKPAHSGVPVPEKMKRLLERQLQDADCSF